MSAYHCSVCGADAISADDWEVWCGDEDCCATPPMSLPCGCPNATVAEFATHPIGGEK